MRINDVYRFFIPDAFTPNDDGYNDFFAPEGTHVDEYELIIYNRWGEELFSSSEGNNSWNGQYKGKPVQQGIYLYFIRLKDKEETSHYYQGKVHLLR